LLGCLLHKRTSGKRFREHRPSKGRKESDRILREVKPGGELLGGRVKKGEQTSLGSYLSETLMNCKVKDAYDVGKWICFFFFLFFFMAYHFKEAAEFIFRRNTELSFGWRVEVRGECYFCLDQENTNGTFCLCNYYGLDVLSRKI
jgi:hypothetical protein